MLHPWPGNVRELASVLEAALLDAAGDVIRPEDLQLHSGTENSRDAEPAYRGGDLSLDDVIRRHVQ